VLQHQLLGAQVGQSLCVEVSWIAYRPRLAEITLTASTGKGKRFIPFENAPADLFETRVHPRFHFFGQTEDGKGHEYGSLNKRNELP
jgi:hypothetical protein